MNKTMKRNLEKEICLISNQIDSKTKYSVCNQAVKTGWTQSDAQRFAKKLWDDGITDGIDNDADSWKSATINSINGDLSSVIDSLKDGSFNGSYADIH